MDNFGKGHGFKKRRGGFGGRKSFDRGGFNRGDRGDRQMFSAVCSNCGKDCQVPFRPTGDKPVYCSDCFEKMGGRSERRSFDRPSGGAQSNDKISSQLESLNIKLDKIINLLQTKDSKPVIPQAKEEVKEVKEETPVSVEEVKEDKSEKKKETKASKAKKTSKKKEVEQVEEVSEA